MTRSMLLILEEIISKKGFSSVEKKGLLFKTVQTINFNGRELSKKEEKLVDSYVFETKEEYHEVVQKVFVGNDWITYFNDKGERGDIEIPFFSGLFSKNGKIYRKLLTEAKNSLKTNN